MTRSVNYVSAVPLSQVSADRKGTHFVKDDTARLDRSDDAVKEKGPPWWRSQRYILAYFLFAGMMNIFFQRVNFSIAIICMVNHTAISSHNRHTDNISSADHDLNNNSRYLIADTDRAIHKSVLIDSTNAQSTLTSDMRALQNVSQSSDGRNNEAKVISNAVQIDRLFTLSHDKTLVVVNELSQVSTPALSDVSNPNNATYYEYDTEKCTKGQASSQRAMEDGPLIWDKELQGVLLGAVYWTYLIVQIPANLVVRNAKKKTIVLVSMSLMSVMTMLMHVAALWSPWAVFAVKLVQGACTALLIIAIYGMWSKWAPPRERASLITLSMSGQNLGNIIVFPVSALLCKHGFLGGWPSIFYVFGGLGFLWIALFFMFADESPSTHQWISMQEREYIRQSLSNSSPARHQKVPWASILMSPPFWGIVIGQFSFTWGLLLILSTLPQYMLEVLKFDIKSNGFYTMLPYIALLFVTQAAGALSDYVIRRGLLSILWTRKLCVLIANLVPAVLLGVMSFLDSNQAGLAVTLLVISVGASGFSLSGILVSPYDIAPRFATELMIIINTAAVIPGILTSYVVAAITKDQTREQWQVVFFLTSGIYLLGAVCFCVMARGAVQPWATDRQLNMDIVVTADSDKVEMRAKEKEFMLNDS